MPVRAIRWASVRGPHGWSGNVRGLGNAVLQSMIFARGGQIKTDSLTTEIRHEVGQIEGPLPSTKEELQMEKVQRTEKY